MNKELITATELLKNHCKENFVRWGKCNCDYYDNEQKKCRLIDCIPVYWYISKPRRFTDKEIALAKALKSFGYTAIKRYKYYERCKAICENYELDLPKIAFQFIEYGETVLIDDIIKDGEI